MIVFKTGDIFTEEAEAIVNTVNCVGVMGRGIALQFKKRFPENFKNYATACRQQKVQPGKMFIYETGKDIIRWKNEIIQSNYFTHLTIHRFPWEKNYSTTEYIGLFNSYSDFLSLPDHQKEEITEAITEALKATHNNITMKYECILIHTIKK